MQHHLTLCIFTITMPIFTMEPFLLTDQVPQLHELCMRHIVKAISSHKPEFCRDREFHIGKLQQENATLLEQETCEDLRIKLKTLILECYHAYLEGCPWQEVKPTLTPTASLLNDPTFCYDYAPDQKLLAAFIKTQKQKSLLQLFSLKKKALISLVSMDLSTYNNVHSIKFSPRGSYVAVAYGEPNHRLEHVLIPIIQCAPGYMQKRRFHMPSLKKVHVYSVHFSPDERYLITRSLHKVTISDLLSDQMKHSEIVPITGTIKKDYAYVMISPTSYHLAARQYGGTIDIYSYANGTPYLISRFVSNFLNNRFHWMPCGTKLLIQEANTNLYWSPYTDTMQNLTTRFPLIHDHVMAHSPCQKYLAYSSPVGTVILDSKLNKYWILSKFLPSRMTFDKQSNLSILQSDGTTTTHAPYEYGAMSLPQLLSVCWLAKSVLNPHKNTSALDSHHAAHCITATEGFQSLPRPIQLVFIKRIKGKL
ncbi:MAG: hypothetical protein AB7F19_01600 [Candidatus Babeliales bacterium]